MTSRSIDRRTFISTGATVCGFCVCAQFPFAALHCERSRRGPRALMNQLGTLRLS